jgi:hypothetical protein
MKEYILNTHAGYCDCSNEKLSNTHRAWMCSHNPERFLFFLGNQFFLITYYRCLQLDYEFKRHLVEKCCKDTEIFPKYEVNKSVDVCKELKNFRIKNQALRKKIEQVNYLYTNAAGKEYAITTSTDYFDHICDQDIIDKNYKIAKEFLESKNYNYLINQLEDLYKENVVYILDRQEIFKSIDHIINSINQLTKETWTQQEA